MNIRPAPELLPYSMVHTSTLAHLNIITFIQPFPAIFTRVRILGSRKKMRVCPDWVFRRGEFLYTIAAREYFVS